MHRKPRPAVLEAPHKYQAGRGVLALMHEQYLLGLQPGGSQQVQQFIDTLGQMDKDATLAVAHQIRGGASKIRKLGPVLETRQSPVLVRANPAPGRIAIRRIRHHQIHAFGRKPPWPARIGPKQGEALFKTQTADILAGMVEHVRIQVQADAKKIGVVKGHSKPHHPASGPQIKDPATHLLPPGKSGQEQRVHGKTKTELRLGEPARKIPPGLIHSR